MTIQVIDNWPHGDRQLWRAASVPASILDEGGAAARCTPSTVRLGLDAYNAWLKHLDRRGDLPTHERPATRITKSRIQAFIEELRITLADATIAMRLHHLHRMVQVMDGEGAKEVAWLSRLARRISTTAKSSRSKTPRLVHSRVLYVLGLSLMELENMEAALTRNSAVRYRDGLMIAMLACRPLRLGELLALRIDETLRKEGECYVVYLEPHQTKSKRRLQVQYPAALTQFIDFYVARVRSKLTRAQEGASDGDLFWLNRRGRAMSRNHVSHRISKLTYVHLGRDISPHLFRDCAATSIAIHDPAHIGISKNVLGHATCRTGEKHYNQADTISAMRRFQSAIRGHRFEE
jgi:integrase/recombinase XerD